ncbi:extracellular calcium-sensing receptor-like [Protopterus annectens]|uniref:extracellular calcium-sensing receptor-like n=1 Tax=Protopterus annectens TaxID=7888 RepID=UPI001CFB67B2|nr:extracellular calcium-sensing receptor-like [Protopterus annectens]
MVFTIQEIQKDPKILPNVTLGFHIFDTCTIIAGALEGTMRLLTGQKTTVPNYCCDSVSSAVAVIGDAYSLMSIPMAKLLGLYRHPQISYSASVVALSDKSQFPSFLRTVPSDLFQSVGLAHLVIYFGWTWVGILAEDSDYGLHGSQLVKDELTKAGTCIAFFETIPTVYSEKKTIYVSEIIRKSSANVIVIYAADFSVYPIMEVNVRNNMTGKVWIASDSWANSPIFSNKEFLVTLQGTLGFMIRRGNMLGFKDFIYGLTPRRNPEDIFLNIFWELAFDCSLHFLLVNKNSSYKAQTTNACSGNETLQEIKRNFFDLDELRFTYNVYNAVYAVAHALHAMNICRLGEGPFSNGTCITVNNFKPWQLLHYLKNIHFRNKNEEEVFFDMYGDPPALYSIINWQPTSDDSFRYLEIGHFKLSADNGEELIIDVDSILWNNGNKQIPQSRCSDSCPVGYRKAAQAGQPICCFGCVMCSQGEISNQSDSVVCLKCPGNEWSNDKQEKCITKIPEYLTYEEPLGKTLAAVPIFMAMAAAAVFIVFVKSWNTPVVKANNRELSYLLLLSLVLCFLSSLIFIGRPTNLTCMSRQVAFGISFTFSVSCILAKTVVVVIAFNASKPNSNLKKFVDPKLPKSLVSLCTFVQIALCVSWLISSPPFQNENTTSVTGKIIIECNEGSPTAFWCMLSYMGLLASVSLVVAFLSRNLPDSFNEAKYITFSMLVFVTVWMSFIPAYLSTQGKYMVAVEVFAIVSSGAGLLICIFTPKCYIILFRPDMNTRAFLIGKIAMERARERRNRGQPLYISSKSQNTTIHHSSCEICKAFIPKTVRSSLASLRLFLENQHLKCLGQDMDLTSEPLEEPQTKKARKPQLDPIAAPSIPAAPPKADEGSEAASEITEPPLTGTLGEAVMEIASMYQRDSQASDPGAGGTMAYHF